MLFKIAKLLLWIKQRLESRFKNRRKCFISKDIYVSNKKNIHTNCMNMTTSLKVKIKITIKVVKILLHN